MSDTLQVAPRTYVDPPSPEAARFGLFSVADMVTEPGSRWELGIEWEPLPSGPAAAQQHYCGDLDDEGVDPDGWPLTTVEGQDEAHAAPFIVTGWYECQSASRPLAEARQRARAHLAAGEERTVERVIATGEAGVAPSLQGAEVLSGDPEAAHVALGRLESYIGRTYGGRGTLHLPRSAGPYAPSYWRRDGERIQTLLGNWVAFGSGYDLANVGPDGSAAPAGTAWAYVTARPRIRRSDPYVQPDDDQQIRRTDNVVLVTASRVYVVAWESVPAATLIDLERT